MARTRADGKAEKYNDDRQQPYPPKAHHPPETTNRADGKIDPLAGIFQNKYKHVHDGQKPTGIAKESSKPKHSADLHPLFLHFKSATDGYRARADASLREDLEGIHDELLARLDRIDVNGKEVMVEGLPSKLELEKLRAERAKLRKPFSEDTINTEIPRADGTTLVSAQPLGKTMAQFQKKVKDTQAKLDPLLKELQEINAEIATALASLGADDATRKATMDFEEKLKELKAEADRAQQLTLDDIAKARKDDKEMTEESKRKLEEFMKSW